TIDRALTLIWIHRALGGTALQSATVRRVALDATWQDTETATGLHVYRWPQATPPAALKLRNTPAPGLVAVAQFDSRDVEQSTLPVRLQRKLYRLVRSEHAPAEKKSDAGAPL